MGFQHRKLMSDPINETCNVCYQFCVSTCSDYCPGVCIPNSPPYIDGYPPPVPISDSPSHTNPTNKFLIVTSTIIAATFLVLCCLVYYIKCFRRRGRSRSSGAETDETRDEFLDQDHGLIVDHPIWYINTIGLQPSIIHSIAVCKYKKGEGLVEGTDCSVCLNEFQEDETLRLLPKCNHAFHIPCIDTWLRSHTNCPMCRAPIVSDSGNRGPPSSRSSSSVNNEGPGRSEETQVVIMEEDGNGEEAERGTNGGVSEIRNEEDELGVENSEDEILQPMRRSASLDSMEACQIRNDIVNGNKTEAPSNSNSKTESSTGKEQSVKIVSRRAAAGNQSLLRSLQSNPIFMRRSASFSGKFSLSISNNSSSNSNSNSNNNNKSHGTNPTLRSF